MKAAAESTAGSPSHYGRVASLMGAAIGILSPKCPLCWTMLGGMAIGGTISGFLLSAMRFAGLAIYFAGFYLLLRKRGIDTWTVLIASVSATALVAAGTWLASLLAFSLSQRILLSVFASSAVMLLPPWLARHEKADCSPCSVGQHH